MEPQSRMRTTLGVWALLALAVCRPVAAHELQASRATLVQRDPNFVAMTLYIDLPAVLHHALAPQTSFAQFALAQVTMPTDAFKAVLLRAANRMQAEMRATTAKGPALAFERWVWPEAARVQAALRERLMESVVASGDHAHPVPLEVHAELHSAAPIAGLRVQFTPLLGRVMVVSYRPKQVWVDTRSVSSTITF